MRRGWAGLGGGVGATHNDRIARIVAQQSIDHALISNQPKGQGPGTAVATQIKSGRDVSQVRSCFLHISDQQGAVCKFQNACHFRLMHPEIRRYLSVDNLSRRWHPKRENRKT